MPPGLSALVELKALAEAPLERHHGLVTLDALRRGQVILARGMLELLRGKNGRPATYAEPQPPGPGGPREPSRIGSGGCASGKETGLRNARAAGAAAALQGKGPADCPYVHAQGGYRNAWLDGNRGERVRMGLAS